MSSVIKKVDKKKKKKTQLSKFDLIPFSKLTQKPKNRRKREWHKFDASYGHHPLNQPKVANQQKTTIPTKCQFGKLWVIYANLNLAIYLFICTKIKHMEIIEEYLNPSFQNIVYSPAVTIYFGCMGIPPPPHTLAP